MSLLKEGMLSKTQFLWDTKLDTLHIEHLFYGEIILPSFID